MSPARAGDDPLPGGGHLGRFEVRSRLGAGGMGVTYLGYDPELRRAVALKVLTVGSSRTDRDVEELLREARAVSGLDHPGVATVYDVGRAADGRPFLAMAYYPGRTLAERLADGPLPVDEGLRIAREVTGALGAAHVAGIVHRDVKPGNIMILPDGSVRVLDFGIAAEVSERGDPTGPITGTPAYVSPEQARGERVDARSDLWSLGVVLFETLTGVHPFAGSTPAATLAAALEARLRPEAAQAAEALPPPVRAVLDRLLSPSPAGRFPDADAVVDALDRVRGPARRSPRRRRVLGLAGAVALAALAVWGVTRLGSPSTHPSTAALAILPPVPAVADPELERIGQELAVALALTLDGLGDIRTVDPLTLLARRDVRDRSVPGAERVRTALERGARGVVTGALARSGDSVRVDLRLVEEAGGESVVRAGVVLPADALTAMTDSLAWQLLRGVWRGRGAPTPSLGGVTTRSLPALRAFLDGERAIVEGRFLDAPEDFAAAVAADSSFVLAAWRLWWTRSWYSEPVDPALRQRVRDEVSRLPPRDSALVGAQSAVDPREAYRLGLEIVETWPEDWLAWFDHADGLVHRGGAFGRERAEARSALERLVRVRPDLVRGWDHLFWIVREQRDTLRMRQALARLEALAFDSLSRRQGGYDDLIYAQVQARTIANGGRLTDDDLALAVSLYRDSEGPRPPLALYSNLLSEGLGAAQLQLDSALLTVPLSRILESAAHFAESLALARAGRWESALDAARRHDALAAANEGALHGFGLAAVGHALGFLPGEAVAPWRTRVATLDDTPDPAVADEVAWLRALDAFGSGDAAALARARAASSGDLAASGAALEQALRGDEAGAGRALAALIDARLGRGASWGPPDHPWFDGVVRIFAARWLAPVDPDAARALLRWHETILPDDDTWWRLVRANRVLEPVALAASAPLEEAAGRSAQADWLRTRVREIRGEG